METYGYVGEKKVKIEDTEFKDFTPTDWAMYFIERWGQIDGSHHKQYVLDQIARVLKGTPVLIKEATWKGDQYEGGILKEYRVSTGTPSAEYKKWAKDMLGEKKDGEYEYDYDEGIAP